MRQTTTLPILVIMLALILPMVTGQETGARNHDDLFFGEVPPGFGQLEKAPKLFSAGKDEQGREFYLNGQLATGKKLILTASNGFFDKGICRAFGESSLPKIGDDDLIKPNFAFLGQWKKTKGTIRWHIWLSRPGQVKLNLNMRVLKHEAGSMLTVSLAGKSQTVKTVESAPSKPQPSNLIFEVAEPGEHEIVLSATKIKAPKSGIGEVHTIDLYGPAIDNAQLLRARWRPAAVHGSYSSSTSKRSKMWVMTTRSACDFNSYSPITTPFGYFGTSFQADRRSSGEFNFSMWAAGRQGKTPPLEQMPHLLAAGSPQAEFSGFGHEGSGVKLRGWTPMPDRPSTCIQALRVESDGNYDTYYGYFWDHPSDCWKLFAVGRKWNDGKPKEHLSPGSFCEIPGPPHLQRSGDQIREVRRRGWHWGNDKKWHPMDEFNCKSKNAANKRWYTTQDGQFAMGTGGMRFYMFEPPSAPARPNALPEFLQPSTTEQLFRLPADTKEITTSQVSNNSAIINLSMARVGKNARAEVYYGENDCLTFVKRELHGTERNSAISQSTQASDRSWSNQRKINSLKDGKNQIKLFGLKPNTNYFFRILVTNDAGQVWSFQTLTFRTTR